MFELMPYWLWTLMLVLLVLAFCALSPSGDEAGEASEDLSVRPGQSRR